MTKTTEVSYVVKFDGKSSYMFPVNIYCIDEKAKSDAIVQRNKMRDQLPQYKWTVMRVVRARFVKPL